eukprot:EC096000.1.p1 GENE.EC096000.1~~EC096000.1.p1  ORF type:complete len:142 (+),score=14.39 EC096000.1:142-567(+)
MQFVQLKQLNSQIQLIDGKADQIQVFCFVVFVIFFADFIEIVPDQNFIILQFLLCCLVILSDIVLSQQFCNFIIFVIFLAVQTILSFCSFWQLKVILYMVNKFVLLQLFFQQFEQVVQHVIDRKVSFGGGGEQQQQCCKKS